MATEKSLKILEDIKSLTILELADLVKAIEEEFGVSLSPTEYDKSQLSTVHKIEQVLKEKGVN